MRSKKIWLGLAFLAFGCNEKEQTTEQIKNIMKNNPDIFIEVLKKHPVKFMEAFQEAALAAQGALAKKQEKRKQEEFEKAFKSPLRPKIRSDEAIRGTRGAPIVLVEYSDFECGFCRRALGTIRSLLKNYDGKIQFIYKHLPLSFHKNALLASKYYEAIRLQDEKKAFQFHDDLYDNQRKIKKGEVFFKAAAKRVGADLKRLQKDISSQKVARRIKEDEKEAAKFGFSGTPGFLLNGIPIRGALPLPHFEKIIKRLQKEGKI